MTAFLNSSGVALRFRLVVPAGPTVREEQVLVDRRIDSPLGNEPIVIPNPSASGRQYMGPLYARLTLIGGDGSQLKSGIVTIRFRRKRRE